MSCLAFPVSIHWREFFCKCWTWYLCSFYEITSAIMRCNSSSQNWTGNDRIISKLGVTAALSVDGRPISVISENYYLSWSMLPFCAVWDFCPKTDYLSSRALTLVLEYFCMLLSGPECRMIHSMQNRNQKPCTGCTQLIRCVILLKNLTWSMLEFCGPPTLWTSI